MVSQFPVLLGGAALTRSYVENDLTEVYEGDVHYARDAFEGLRLMDDIMTRKRGGAVEDDSPAAVAEREKAAERKARHERSKRIAAERRAKEAPVEVPERSDVAADLPVAVPPFWGTRVVKGLAVGEYSGLLDERALFLGQWGLRGQRGGDGPSYEELVESDGRPRLRYWLDRLTAEGVLQHAAVVYGYFPAVSEGDDVIVLEAPDPAAPERYRFTFRASSATGSCASPISSAPGTSRSKWDRSTCCRSSWSPWGSRSRISPTSCSRRTITATISRCTASACS